MENRIHESRIKIGEEYKEMTREDIVKELIKEIAQVEDDEFLLTLYLLVKKKESGN